MRQIERPNKLISSTSNQALTSTLIGLSAKFLIH
jgi:hypothetical protein